MGIFRRFLLLSTILAAGPVVAMGTPESSTETPQTKIDDTKISTGNENPDLGKAGSYLAARYASRHQDNQKASYFLSHTLEHDPYNTGLMGKVIRQYVLSGDIDNAVKVAENSASLNEKNNLLHLLLFVNAVKKDDNANAKLHLDAIDGFGLNAITKPFYEAWLSYQATHNVKEIKPAIELKNSFYDALKYYQQALIYDLSGDMRKASLYYELATKKPDQDPYRVIVAAVDFYRRQGDLERARGLYKSYQQESDGNLIADTADADQLMKELSSHGNKKLVSSPSEGVAEVLLNIAHLLATEQVTPETMVYIRLALYLRPEFPEAELLMGNILEEQGQYEQAIAAYDRIPSGTQMFRRGQIRKAFSLDSLGRTDEGLSLLESMANQYSKPSDIYMSIGDLFRRKENYAAATDAYTSAIKAIGSLERHHWPLLYARGICYEQAGNWPKAEADFNQALKLEPDQPDVLNYLAYSWLVQGNKIKDAQKMLERAVAERPDDANIIDSLGWASYLQGNYQEALEYLEQAVELMPHDPTVNDHYGDALWQLGRHTEARYQWERALYYKPKAEADRVRIEQKMKTGVASSSSDARTANKTPTNAE
ncbi:MAG: tetratricopeptide repeat protein [Rickettsiales bacterium]